MTTFEELKARITSDLTYAEERTLEEEVDAAYEIRQLTKRERDKLIRIIRFEDER